MDYSRIRVVYPNGNISTFAGTGEVSSYFGGAKGDNQNAVQATISSTSYGIFGFNNTVYFND